MVKAFHDAGIKVFIDVVYNHTGEGGAWIADDPSTYNLLLVPRPGQPDVLQPDVATCKFNWDNTGRGRQLQHLQPGGAGPDRPLAGVLEGHARAWTASGSTWPRCWATPASTAATTTTGRTPNTALNRIIAGLPPRPAGGGAGTDFIAEPWAIGGNSYQVGNFPARWAEWNGSFRDTFRKDQNKMGVGRGHARASWPRASRARRTCTGTTAASRQLHQLHGGPRRLHPEGPVLVQQQEQRPGVALRARRTAARTTTTAGTRAASRRDQRKAARNGIAFLMLQRGHADDHRRRRVPAHASTATTTPYNLDSNANWLDYDAEHGPDELQDVRPAADRVPQGAPGAAPGELLQRRGQQRERDGAAPLVQAGRQRAGLGVLRRREQPRAGLPHGRHGVR